MIVSRAYLDALRQQAPKTPMIELQPDGTTVETVHYHIEQHRLQTLHRGEMELKIAQSKLREALSQARKEGVTRSHFNGMSHTT